MKKIISITFLLAFSFSLVNAQIADPDKVIKKQGTRRANNKIERGVDKGFDKLEEGLGRLFGKKKKRKKKKKEYQSSQEYNQTNGQNKPTGDYNKSDRNDSQKAKSPNIIWNKFDFVPGDIVIFEDEPSIYEENGEFPSRWDLVSGNSEIIESEGTHVIGFRHGGTIVPYLKNAEKDYLPDVFTLELDVFHSPKCRRLWIYLYDKRNQRSDVSGNIELNLNRASVGKIGATYPNKDKYDKKGGWRHISLAFTKGKLKVYIDDVRLVNIPHFEGNPTGITLKMDGFAADKQNDIQYIKNIRIAKGGVKYYDRLLQDGKIIVNGIRFDTGKATIKPESLGAINSIFKLLQKQAKLNFSVEGHTDNDGNNANNMSLSKARGKAVMEQLITMGISANRLKSNGYGESKPIENNSTAEGKANNRRVEFVQFASTSNVGNNNSSDSAFDKLNRKSIGDKLETLPNERIQISIHSGILLGVGTIIGYATKDGRVGKMEFLDIDKNNNYKLTIKYVTYNFNGSVYSQSNHLEIEGTQNCDLDDGTTEGVTSKDKDFQLGRTDKTNTVIWTGEESILRVLK